VNGFLVIGQVQAYGHERGPHADVGHETLVGRLMPPQLRTVVTQVVPQLHEAEREVRARASPLFPPGVDHLGEQARVVLSQEANVAFTFDKVSQSDGLHFAYLDTTRRL